MKHTIAKTLAAVSIALGLSVSAQAAEAPAAPAQDWSFNGAFGTYDRAALQRGFQVYQQVCGACHSLKYVAFRTLGGPSASAKGGPGFTEAQMKAIAASYSIADIDDDGEVVDRPGKPSDKVPSPFPNKKAAEAANNGKAPPDLSLMAKARMGGPDYIFALLTGYHDEAPHDAHIDVPDGAYYNDYFPGHVIAMAPPLFDDLIEYQDGTPATVEQMARDVSHFLMWTAEPKLEQRKGLGARVIGFLLILSVLLYLVKKKVWRDAH